MLCKSVGLSKSARHFCQTRQLVLKFRIKREMYHEWSITLSAFCYIFYASTVYPVDGECLSSIYTSNHIEQCLFCEQMQYHIKISPVFSKKSHIIFEVVGLGYLVSASCHQISDCLFLVLFLTYLRTLLFCIKILISRIPGLNLSFCHSLKRVSMLASQWILCGIHFVS